MFRRSCAGGFHWCRVAVFCVIIALLQATGGTPAHAVSQGCAAVRGGALNVTVAANNVLVNANFFTAAFEAGERIQWTIANEFDAVTITANGNGVALTGLPPSSAAALSINANGNITFGYNLDADAAEQLIITATCLESRSERQGAQNVLLNAQLDADLQQQRQFQDDLASLTSRNELLRERQLLEEQLALHQQNIAELRELRDEITANMASLSNQKDALKTRISELRSRLRTISSSSRRLRYMELIRELTKTIEVLQTEYAEEGARRASVDQGIQQAQAEAYTANARIAEIDALLAGGSGGGVNFQLSSAPMLLGQPASLSPFDAPALGAAPFGFSASGHKPAGAASPAMSFMMDLNGLRESARRKAVLAQAPGTTAPLPGTTAAGFSSPGYNVWMRGSVAGFDADQANAKRDGSSTDLATGAYVNAGDSTLLGAYYRYRDAESESPSQSSTLDTRGHAIGLHATRFLGTRITGSLHALYEFSDNDITTAGGNGSFDAEQLTLHGKVEGSFSRGNMSIEPAAQVTYALIDHDSYTDSSGGFTPGNTIERGQLVVGPCLSWRKPVNGPRVRTISPSLTLNGIWNFMEAGDTTLTNGAVVQGDELAANVIGGLSMEFNNGAQLGLSGAWTGLGDSEQHTYSLSGQIRIPLGR